MKKKNTPNSYQRVLQRARGGLLTKFKSRKGGKSKSPSSSPVNTPLSSSTTTANKNKSSTTKPSIATKTQDVAVPNENDMNINAMPCSPRSITTYETQKIDNTAKKSTTKAPSPASFPSVIEEEEMSEGLSTEYTFETATTFTALTANTNETSPGENLLPELDNACCGLLFATDKKKALVQAVDDINESGKSSISTVVDDFNKGSGYLLSTVAGGDEEKKNSNTAHTQTTTTNLDVVVEDEPESLWSKLVTNVNNIAGITTNNDQSTVMDQSTIQTDLTTEYSYGVDSLTTGTMSTNDDGSHTIDSLVSDEKKEKSTALQNEWMDNKRVVSSSSPTPSTSSSQKKKFGSVILKKVRSTSPKLFAKKIVKNTSIEEEGSKSPSTTTTTELGSIATEKGSMAASKSSKNSSSSSKKKINKSRTTSRTPSPLTMLRARSMAKKNTASDVVVVVPDVESVDEAATSNASPTIAVEEGSVQKPQEQGEKKDTAEISKDNETKSITKSARLSPVNVMDFDNTDEVEVSVLDEDCEVKEDTIVKSSSVLCEDNEKVDIVGKESSPVVEEKEQLKDQQEDSMLQTISVEANEIMNQVNDLLKVEEIAGQ